MHEGQDVADILGRFSLTQVLAAVEADILATRREFAFRLRPVERLFASQLCDQRDLPVLSVLTSVLVVTFPTAVGVYCSSSHFVGLGYLILNYALFLQRFLVALLHVTEHRRLFQPGCCAVNEVVPLLLAPLFGIPSGMYRVHHKVMHHVEGNAYPLDTSSTEPYQRDRLDHFLWYWTRHTFAAWLEVPLYALRQRRTRLFCQCVATESAYLVTVYLLWQLHATATTWVFIIPYFATSVALMLGNWSQHMFLQEDPAGSAYRLTYNCVANRDNQLTLNDGYHIQHHLNSQLHWSELPQRFLDTIADHSRHKALVFQHIGVFEVGMLTFLGKLDVLAQHMLPCGAEMALMSMSDRVALLQARLRPIR